MMHDRIYGDDSRIVDLGCGPRHHGRSSTVAALALWAATMSIGAQALPTPKPSFQNRGPVPHSSKKNMRFK